MVGIPALYQGCFGVWLGWRHGCLPRTSPGLGRAGEVQGMPLGHQDGMLVGGSTENAIGGGINIGGLQ